MRPSFNSAWCHLANLLPSLGLWQMATSSLPMRGAFDSVPQQQEVVAHLLDQQARFFRGLHGLRAIRPLQQTGLDFDEKS